MKAFVQHSLGALGVMMTIGLVSSIFISPYYVATATAVAFTYYGREVSQAQTDIAKRLRTTRQAVWYAGWTYFEWNSTQKILESVAPATVAYLAAYLIGRCLCLTS